MNNYFENEYRLIPFKMVSSVYKDDDTTHVYFVGITDAIKLKGNDSNEFLSRYREWLKFESLKANVRLDAMMPGSSPIIR
jgi:hypothetical protein